MSFTLCDLELADMTSSVQQIFIDEVKGLLISGVNDESIVVSSMVEDPPNVILVVTAELSHTGLENFICQDVKCVGRLTCPQCEA